MKFSGIDLHSNNSVVVVSDEAERIVYQRRLPNDPVQIRAALAPHRENQAVYCGCEKSNSYTPLARADLQSRRQAP